MNTDMRKIKTKTSILFPTEYVFAILIVSILPEEFNLFIKVYFP